MSKRNEETTGRTVVGLFHNQADAERAIRRLKDEGFSEDQIGVAIDRQFEEFVIGRIPAEREALGDGDQLGRGKKPAYAIEKDWRNLGREARTLQDVEKFLLRGGAFQETAISSD